MACASQQPAALPQEVEAVRKHILERDYPELFGSDAYRTRIENVVVRDLDGDGSHEVVVLYRPHYRQSATIAIYRLSKDLEVTRVMEGLAPGPLQPISGEYLDSHALGQAADMSVAMPGGQAELVAAFMRSGFGGLVEYATFVHADSRKGDPSFVDLSRIEIPDGRKTCEAFEFSRVDEIAVGPLEGGTGETYLVARVGSELWVYRIIRFLPNGLLEKEVRVRPIPEDFASFEPGGHETLRYLSSGGELRPLLPAP